MFKPEIFRAYDIRGVYGQDFDAAFAQRLGSKVAAYLGTGTIVIGRDARSSSDDLAYAVIDGALHAGLKVVDIGQVSTPQFHWAVSQLGTGGIMVTASHNPENYNGFKVVDRRDGTFDELGGDRLRQIYDSQTHGHSAGGTVQQQDVIAGYAQAVAAAAGWRGQELKISIDAPEAVRKGLELMGPIAPDHGLAARFDPDGDRIAFFQDGKAIAPDWLLLVLVDKLQLQPVTFDLLFSRAVSEYVSSHAVSHIMTLVGHTAVVPAMRRLKAELGAELSGHYYWRQFGDMEAPELVLLHMLTILERTGKDIGQLVSSYAKYAKSDIVNIPVRDRKAVGVALNKLRKLYSGCIVSDIDGVTVDCWDKAEWWFNARPSNTEPLLRLVVEAKEKDLMEEKVREVTAALGKNL